MRLRRLSSLTWRGLALASVATGLVLVGPGASYGLDGDECSSINATDTETTTSVTDFQSDGSPAALLRTEAAQRRVVELSGRPPGQGVVVAVLDSGVLAQPGLTVQRGQPAPGATSTDDLVYHQGTMLAGVIAAAPDGESEQPVGIAPGATIYDQRIYDTGVETDDELTQLGPESVAEGLEAIAPLVGSRAGDISIVVIGVDSPESPRLRAAVDLVTGKGAIIVAASAARTDAVPFVEGEDLADLTWPAGYAKEGARGQAANPLVVSVTTTATSGDGEELLPEDFIIFSSAIDVAAPTAGAVSLGLNSVPCSIGPAPVPAVAAAEVAGVLALLQSAFPGERPQQLITRLEATATGAATFDPAIPDTRQGKGVIQPLEALTRPQVPDRAGRLPVSVLPEREEGPAVLPVDPPDVLASTRENAVWWGLLGGGGLAALILLRPVLSRRR